MGVEEGVPYLFPYTPLGLEGLRLVGEQPTDSQAGHAAVPRQRGARRLPEPKPGDKEVKAHKCPFRLEQGFVERSD